MNDIIKLEIKQKKFKDKNYSILKNFTLNVMQGEKISIIGESGVGKTSLLNILGLLDTNFQGEYKLFDSNIKNLSQNKLSQWRNQKIGFVLQDSALINSLSIEDNIKLPLLYSKLEKDLNAEDHFKRIVN